MSKTLTAEQLHVLQHSLGLDKYGQGTMYRNHFCAGGVDIPICESLVAIGYMRRHLTNDVFPYYNCSVTDAGIEAVRSESPPPPRLTRSQQRYRAFLKADTGYSFGEWLASHKGKGGCP